MMEVKPLSDSDPKLLLRFSRYLTESRTCYQCGEKVLECELPTEGEEGQLDRRDHPI